MRNDEFEWHDAKAKLNERDHGVSFEEARRAFDDPRAINRLDLDETDEGRILLTGLVGDVLLTVCHVERGGRKRPPERHRNVSKTITTRRTRSRKRGSRSKADENGMRPEMWANLEAMTDEEVLAAARRDPDAKPLEDRDPASLGPARHVARATRIRWALRMSKAQFARTFRIPLATLREWEYHLQEPDEAARAYLEVIAREPDAVRRALSARPAKARKAA